MSQLIQMRQRIKAVETIKKITHAMRLISMSSHSRLRLKKGTFEEYTKSLRDLFLHIVSSVPEWHDAVLFPPVTTHKRELLILIGSQKGLCGNFNNTLLTFFEKHRAKFNPKQIEIISVGKKMHEYLAVNGITPTAYFDDFSNSRLTAIARHLMNHILTAKTPYSSVSIMSNYPKSFFNQKPTVQQLIPFGAQTTTESDPQDTENVWYQTPQEIVHYLGEYQLYVQIYAALLNSLVAEQAARFLAMDNSTRNASNLLDTMKLEYNKLRQAKITRELTDLISSF